MNYSCFCFSLHVLYILYVDTMVLVHRNFNNYIFITNFILQHCKGTFFILLMYVMPLAWIPFCLILIPCCLSFLLTFAWHVFAYPFNFSKSFWYMYLFLISIISRNASNVFSESMVMGYIQWWFSIRDDFVFLGIFGNVWDTFGWCNWRGQGATGI